MIHQKGIKTKNELVSYKIRLIALGEGVSLYVFKYNIILEYINYL